MKILQVINNLELAGAERLVHDLCLEFQHRHHSVSVFLLNETGSPLEKNLRDSGIPLISSGTENAKAPCHARRLAEHLRRHPYDVVHAHLFPAQLWCAAARRLSRSGARFYTTEHSFTTRRRRPAIKAFDAVLYRHFEAVSCVSGAAANSFLAWLPQYRDRTVTICNGIDTSRFGIAGNDALPSRLISVGRCEPVKRHDVTLRALALLHEATLWIVGEGPARLELTALAERLGVAERVQFLGLRTDLASILPRCGIFVQSSEHEGFGLAALEAMACGIPIVCSDIPGLRDTVGDAALTFIPGSHGALAGCVRSILTDRRLAADLANAARRRAHYFSIENTAAEYLHLYSSRLGSCCDAASGAPRELTA